MLVTLVRIDLINVRLIKTFVAMNGQVVLHKLRKTVKTFVYL